MSLSISLTVQLDDPCQENWNEMTATQQGRFCNKCEKPVVDFTDFTDQQMLHYFLANPIPVCGRLRPAQRGQPFEATVPKVNRRLSPVAATLLTLTAISTEASAHNVHPAVSTQQHQQPVYKPTTLTDSVTISGTVKDAYGAPIENAEIVFGDIKLLSDKNGYFQFVLPTAITKPAVIQFSHNKLEPEVRSYHPVMGSTSYDVVLYAGHMPEYMILGIIKSSYHLSLLDTHSTLTFQSVKLDQKTQDFLDTLGNLMKNLPEATLSIKTYYKTNPKKAMGILKLVKDYLVNRENISEERFQWADPQPKKQLAAEVVIELKQPMSDE